MADTYSQIYIQIVFAVKRRVPLIHPSWENELYKYITGIVQKKGQILIAINGVSDHIHILIAMKPTCCLSDLVREIKKSSNEYIKTNNFCQARFSWQEGFGAFSYNQSQLDRIVNYISRQKEHHAKISFKSEYITLLKEFDVNFKEEYLFEF
ncbi:MAG: transposase [Bacteroidetes bacterium]|jgi:REP element-mobilizing transposase RayT|nr:transposase [Bacteroidota bacterium]